jgi:hypothetical protein
VLLKALSFNLSSSHCIEVCTTINRCGELLWRFACLKAQVSSLNGRVLSCARMETTKCDLTPPRFNLFENLYIHFLVKIHVRILLLLPAVTWIHLNTSRSFGSMPCKVDMNVLEFTSNLLMCVPKQKTVSWTPTFEWHSSDRKSSEYCNLFPFAHWQCAFVNTLINLCFFISEAHISFSRTVLN